jgi:hypothetical protein
MSQELYHRIAILESQVDHLESELHDVNDKLLRCGFPEGIKTLKKTLEEIMIESPVDLSEGEAESF